MPGRAPKDYALNKRMQGLVTTFDKATAMQRKIAAMVKPGDVEDMILSLIESAKGCWIIKEEHWANQEEAQTRIYQSRPNSTALKTLATLCKWDPAEVALMISTLAKAEKDLSFVDAGIAPAQAQFLIEQARGAKENNKLFGRQYVSEEQQQRVTQKMAVSMSNPIMQVDPDTWLDQYVLHGITDDKDRDIVKAILLKGDGCVYFKDQIGQKMAHELTKVIEDFETLRIEAATEGDDETAYEEDEDEPDAELDAQMNKIKYEE